MEDEACQGVSLCGGDRAWCRDPRWQETQVIGSYTNCQGNWSGQFVHLDKFSDSTKYDCLDRSDETVFSDGHEELDLPILETCTDSYGQPGLRCHDSRGEDPGDGYSYSETIRAYNITGCVSSFYWCRGPILPCAALGGRSISDAALCANRT